MAIKRVLITGSNSYVGTNVEKWLMKEPDKFYVETISVRGDAWKSFDFSKFDVVFHVAGIAHVSPKKSMKNLYNAVNRDLAIEVAKKAKESGIRQFIFMSSMIVYSSKETRITKETLLNPDNFYGKSKLDAEEGLNLLKSNHFNICILRTPVVYGPNSKGNFYKLILFAIKTPIFPNWNNKRSMIFIDNLSNTIKHLIDNNSNGIFFPQNKEYVNTKQVILTTKKIIKKSLYLPNTFNVCIYVLKNKFSVFNKLFSDSYYDMEMSLDIISYSLTNFPDSILNTLNKKIHE